MKQQTFNIFILAHKSYSYNGDEILRLILTSCDFQNKNSKKCIFENLNVSVEDCRILFVPNEKATKERIHSEEYYGWVLRYGFQRQNIFVFDYYAPEKYVDLNIDAIYISGGNTFRTLDRIKKCGFDKAIISYVNNGVMYIGGSAGAHIATKNVEHVLSFDDNTTGITDFDGLGLFDGILFCHYTDERKKYYEKAVLEGKYKAYTLTDDEFIVVKKSGGLL